MIQLEANRENAFYSSTYSRSWRLASSCRLKSSAFFFKSALLILRQLMLLLSLLLTLGGFRKW